MKIAVIADIHSNYLALENALSMLDKPRPDGVIFLGDYVSDCPYPERTMALLYEAKSSFNCYFVRGNREDYLLERRHGLHPEWSLSSSTGSLLYTYENLTEKDLDFFESMPFCTDVVITGAPVITACHGSPKRTKEWIKGNDALTEKYLKEISGEILLCGHTHSAGVYNALGKKAIFCPSIGLGQDHAVRFGMTYLELIDSKWVFKMVDVSFDVDKLIRDFHESGLIDCGKIWSRSVIKLLKTRTDYPLRTVSLAWEKSKLDGYTAGAPLPEKYWEQAAKELGVI